MDSVIKRGDRVRVVVNRQGRYHRSFNGEAVDYTGGGVLRVQEDGTKSPRPYSPANVRKIANGFNYGAFCQLLNDNLVYAFTNAVDEDTRDEWQHEWYTLYKGSSFADSINYPTHAERVVAWMCEHFQEHSFDSHFFQLKTR